MSRTKILEEIQKNVELLSTTGLAEYKYIPLHQKPSPSVTALREIMTLLRKVHFPWDSSGRNKKHRQIPYNIIQVYIWSRSMTCYRSKSITAYALKSNVVVTPRIVLLK